MRKYSQRYRPYGDAYNLHMTLSDTLLFTPHFGQGRQRGIHGDSTTIVCGRFG